MPAARVFLDSSTLLYALDETEPDKRDRSQIWLNALAVLGCGVTNLQVLNEVANVLIRKSVRFPKMDVFSKIDALGFLGASPLTWPTHLHARLIHAGTGYSWWDSLLLASALELGCTHFLSEDLQDGQVVEGLTIVDPFSTSPGDILISL